MGTRQHYLLPALAAVNSDYAHLTGFHYRWHGLQYDGAVTTIITKADSSGNNVASWGMPLAGGYIWPSTGFQYFTAISQARSFLYHTAFAGSSNNLWEFALNDGASSVSHTTRWTIPPTGDTFGLVRGLTSHAGNLYVWQQNGAANRVSRVVFASAPAVTFTPVQTWTLSGVTDVMMVAGSLPPSGSN